MDFYYATVENDVLVLRVDGGLNAQTAEQFLKEISDLIDAGMRKIVIDCSQLEYISSFGLGVLVRLHARMARAGGEVRLARIKGVISKVLHLTRLDKTFEVYPEVDAALQAFVRAT